VVEGLRPLVIIVPLATTVAVPSARKIESADHDHVMLVLVET
jgi:hypothetical protein